ncbi:hypothetical protein [Mycolicibacter minnesotensis]
MADRGIAVEAQALSAGVETLAPSAARVAVVLRSTQTADGEQIKQVVVPVRITLVKQDGHWLVAGMSPIHAR